MHCMTRNIKNGCLVNSDSNVPYSKATALQQIKLKNYPESVAQYTGDILLVGINYDKKSKSHQCLIECFEKMTVRKTNRNIKKIKFTFK